MNRPPVPEAVRLQLRQEACFGCCICGSPVFDYQHIIPWAEEQHFRPVDMMVLCPNHHRQATLKALTPEQQRSAKSSPFNRVHGKVAGQLVVQQAELAIKLGGNTYIDTPILLEANGRPLVSMKHGPAHNLELGLELFDRRGILQAWIKDNEWEARSDSNWDLEFDYQWLRIRNGPRDIAVEIDAHENPMTIRGQIWFKGHRIELSPDRTNLLGSTVSGGTFRSCAVGIGLDL